jgi:hypothetical protein
MGLKGNTFLKRRLNFPYLPKAGYRHLRVFLEENPVCVVSSFLSVRMANRKY